MFSKIHQTFFLFRQTFFEKLLMFSMRLSEAYSVHQIPANEKPGEMISHSSGFFFDRFAICGTMIIKLPGPELLRRLRQVSDLVSHLLLRHLRSLRLLLLLRKNTLQRLL